MSWSNYCSEQLVGAGLSAGAILGGGDGGVWAKEGVEIKNGEGQGLVALYKCPSDAFAKGITVGGIKYMGIKADERSIYGKKGAGGCVCVKTGQTIIVGIYDEKTQPGNAALIVEKLGDYLIDNGY